MKKFAALLAASLGGCTTISPCFGIGTHDSLHQVGFVLTNDHNRINAPAACESPLNNDYLDPPIPFDDNIEIPE